MAGRLVLLVAVIAITAFCVWEWGWQGLSALLLGGLAARKNTAIEEADEHEQLMEQARSKALTANQLGIQEAEEITQPRDDPEPGRRRRSFTAQ